MFHSNVSNDLYIFDEQELKSKYTAIYCTTLDQTITYIHIIC